PAALTRELAEETGLDLSEQDPAAILDRTYVNDWRATDHAWGTSTVALYTRPGVVPAQAADDAMDAVWMPVPTLGQLAADLAEDGGLYEAHRPMVAAALDHLTA